MLLCRITVSNEPLVVLREHVSRWTNLELGPVKSAEASYVAPHAVLAAKVIGARKVINLLVAVRLSKLLCAYTSSP